MFEQKIYTLFDYIIGIDCSYLSQIKHLKNRGSKSVQLDLVINQSNQFDKNVNKTISIYKNKYFFFTLVDSISYFFITAPKKYKIINQKALYPDLTEKTSAESNVGITENNTNIPPASMCNLFFSYFSTIKLICGKKKNAQK